MLNLTLDARDDRPLFLQIAHAVADAVRTGRLTAGQRLPGQRKLAAAIGVHRNTVVAAYDELAAEGWVETSPMRGTFVAADLPVQRVAELADGRAARAGFDLGPTRIFPAIDERPSRGAIVLAGGAPDLDLVPKRALARAYRRALLDPRDAVLDYGDPQGHIALRRQLASMLAEERGIVATAEQILLVRGAQMAFRLIADAFTNDGDTIAVEAFGYPPAWAAFSNRADLQPIPVDEEGLSVDILAKRIDRGPVRAVYVTPHHQYPTMVVLSAARRLALLELARQKRMMIIEDDYDNEVHYRGRPVLPLASDDRGGVVVYVGTLSKVLAPGLRLGYVVAPTPVIQRLTAHRRYIDRQGDQAVERAVAELLEEGEVQRHTRRMRRIYAERREAMLEALDRYLPGFLDVHPHDGGMAMWIGASGIDVDRWAANARTEGVWFQTARRFAFDRRRRPYIRLGFAGVEARKIQIAVRRMAAVLP